MNLQYTNHSPDPISFIWFHVWSNAYRNDRTLYSDQLLENGDTRFYFSSKEQKGYINRLEFRVNGILAGLEDHPEYLDVVKLILPKPLSSGDSISISTAFHLRLPFNFNGNGFNAHHFELKNWYPEPAVYDVKGWHPMPFLLQGGAYHESADYNVEIKAPVAYQIVAGAKSLVKEAGKYNLHLFSLTNANSFAWIADDHYLLKTEDIETSAGNPLKIQYYYSVNYARDSTKIAEATKKEIRLLAKWLGPYPHEYISVAECTILEDQDFSGIVCLGTYSKKSEWSTTLRQGLVGQWFQTILMTDQRNQPWFSKGFIGYYEQRLLAEMSRYPSRLSNNLLWLRVAENERTAQSISRRAPEFSMQNNTLIATDKAGLWVRLLKDSLPDKGFDQNMLHYISIWQFRHPSPDDFKKMMDSSSGKNLQALFDKLNSNQSLFKKKNERILKPTFIFSAKESNHFNYVGVAPVPGYNRYDGFMLGALIHNINLPKNHFEFLFTPLYAFGSKTIEGLGRLSYSWHPEKHVSKIAIGLNGGRFDSNKATDSLGNPLFEKFVKWVPYIRIDFNPSNPRSSISRWMDFKSFLISEKSFGNYKISSVDSLIHPNSISSQFRYVNQLSFNLQDSRALYPYDLRLEFQQSELFYRINLHADYFLNYPKGGGLQVRFFAAQFGVWNSVNQSQVNRYEPKLLGVIGDEDYLYENYFIGRSASFALEKTSVPNGGGLAQQIMNRDGGLKLRIDDYDYVQGKSASWVSSLNFNTSLPAKLFPFPIPVRLFFDVGTYSEAWQNNPPTSHFLYTGGVQLSLFGNLLNIYAPLIYSSDFKDVLGGVSFGRKITFSIDIQNINYKKMIGKLAEHE